MSKEIERQYSEILEKPPGLLTEVEKFVISCNGMLKIPGGNPPSAVPQRKTHEYTSVLPAGGPTS